MYKIHLVNNISKVGTARFGRRTLEEDTFHQRLAKEAHYRQQRNMLKAWKHKIFRFPLQFIVPFH